MIRAPSRGSPAARSSSISDTRPSPRIFFVCSASREMSSTGDASAWLATLTNEQYGSPLAGIRVASAPCRLRRSSERASLEASKLAFGCMVIFRAILLQKRPFLGQRGCYTGCGASPQERFAELGHTSAQLALLVDRVRSQFMRRLA